MAGASMKDIKLRIKSVESTMQITKAMQLVATSKLRRAKEKMESSKPYASIARDAVHAAIASCTDETVAFVTGRSVKRRCYVIIAGDRGLAGGYNNNIFKAERLCREDGIPCCALPLGRKAIEHCRHDGIEILSEDFVRVEGTGVSSCFKMAKLLTEGYEQGDFDEVILVYTDFKSMLSQEVATEKLLPLDRPESDGRAVSTIYEPEPADLLASVLPDFLAGRIYSAVCDSYASEVAARRNAMNSATTNAETMIADLRLRYNRARQGSITQEITEIVAGAEQ